MNWTELRDRLKSRGAGRLLLGVLALAYGIAVLVRRFLYAAGLLRSRSLAAKVVCIGNLTTGGTGKTPAAILAAETLRERGQSVAILSRGYGRRRQGSKVTVLLDDAPPPWTECGDEPWMMQHALRGRGVPILVSPDRAKAGEEAVTFYHSRVLILDDGFQHFKLRRDLDIVLVNATDPFGGGRLLPLGDLREPLSALKRAGLVMLTHADRAGAEALSAIKRNIRAFNPEAPIIEAAHRPEFLLDLRTEEKLALGRLKGREVVALSALADPASFESQLTALGATLAQRWRYPDHHPYTLAEIRAVDRLRRGLPVLTTFKDFTRLPEGWRDALSGEVLCLGIKIEILDGRGAWIEALSRLAPAAPEPS